MRWRAACWAWWPIEGKWQRPEQVSRSIREDPNREARTQEYLKRRIKTPDRAEDQWKLALWCDQNDLKQQATAHLYRVLMLDPSREAAWKRLGFKKSGGRWSKPEQIAAAKAEAQAQHKANAHWKTTLEKWANALSHKDKSKRAEAEKGLAEVTDPRAVPMIWVIFAQGSEPAPEDRSAAAGPDRFAGRVAGARASGRDEPKCIRSVAMRPRACGGATLANSAPS